MSPLAYRLASGALWSFVGAAISRALALLASIVVARILVKEAYGALGAIQGTVGFFGSFAGFGLGFAATKYISEYRRTDPGKAGRIIAFASLVTGATAFIVGLSLFFLANYLARSILASPALTPELQIAALFLFMGTVNGLQLGILSGFEAFKSIATINLWAGLASAPIQMAGAWLAGLRGSVWSLVVASLLNVVIAQFAIRKTMAKDHVTITYAGCGKEARMVAGFGSSVVFVGLIVACTNWLGTTFVVNQKSGYAEMATLGAANNWFGIVVFFAATIQQGIFPALSESIGRGNKKETLKIVGSSLLLALSIATPLALLAIIGSPWIMGLYGRGFASAWPVLALTVSAAWVYCFHVFFNQFLLALNRPKLYLFTHLVWAGSFVALLYSRLRGGAEGLALSRALSYLIHVFLTVFILWRLLRDGRAQVMSTSP